MDFPPAKRASDAFPERSEKIPGLDNFFGKKMRDFKFVPKSGESIPGFIFLLIYKIITHRSPRF